ncbi:MAG: hypothetical protein ACLFU7_05465 [Armatimonadota bacterium]
MRDDQTTSDEQPEDEQPEDEQPEDEQPEDEQPEDEQAADGEAGEAEEAEDEELGREELAAEPAGVEKEPPSPTEPEVVKRSPVTFALTVIVIVAIVAIGIWAIMNLARPTASELVQETMAKYREAEHIHVESTMSYDTTMAEDDTTMSLPTTAWFSQPNQMSFEAGPEMQQVLAVSDGESLYIDIAMVPGAIKLPAPDTIAEMPLDRLSMSTGLGVQNMILPDIASILSGAFEVTETTRVEYGIDEATDPWLASLEGPSDSWAVTVQPADGPVVALWIDKTDRLVRKYAALIDYQALVSGDPAIEQQIESLPEERQEEIRQMETRLEADVQTVQLGQQPPEGTFTFQPAEGTEIVEADTIEEGMQELTTLMMGEQGMPEDMPPGEAPPSEGPPSEGPPAEAPPAEE